ncbi:MAG: lipoyl synthase [Eubacteriales bacterium]|nr:lipoyl synthase [Eubacteriales bacterium]MDN5363861.1 lipoyl synthase [Eubacteriales bacterium]
MAGVKFPSWLKKRVPTGEEAERLRAMLHNLKLHTVCQEARCPNIGECFSRRTATFMILGDTCTRNCSFCAVKKGNPAPPDPTEPERVAEAVAALGLTHAVITSVTRDDLPDGGAGHFAAVIKALQRRCPQTTVEVLVPDFGGSREALRVVLAAGPHVLNHNLETVPRLYDRVRPLASYRRSLALLAAAKEEKPGVWTKTGLMLGLGETDTEVIEVMYDLREVGCDILTLGQYLPPTPQHYPLQEFVPPEVFACLREKALQLGFVHVEAGPFVRSSYKAAEFKNRRSK